MKSRHPFTLEFLHQSGIPVKPDFKIIFRFIIKATHQHVIIFPAKFFNRLISYNLIPVNFYPVIFPLFELRGKRLTQDSAPFRDIFHKPFIRNKTGVLPA